jgi:hypothetical protein
MINYPETVYWMSKLPVGESTEVDIKISGIGL